MFNKKHSIRTKLTSLLFGVTIATLGVTGAAALYGLYSLKDISVSSSRSLGQMAAEDAEIALKELAGEQLYTIAGEKALQIEGRFKTVTGYVNGVASLAERIYAESEKYPDREVALPDRESKELEVQLLRSGKLAYPTSEQEAERLKLGNIQELLVEYNRNNDMIASVYLATKSGWMIHADYRPYSKYSGTAKDPDYFEADTRQWYQQALLMNQGQTTYSDVIEDAFHGGDCIVCSQPVYYDGEIVAVAGIDFYLDAVNHTVLNTKIGESGYAFLVNQKGRVIFSPKTESETAAYSNASDLRESKNKELAKAAENMVKGNSGITQLRIDGREVYLAYTPLETLGWSFAAVMDMEEVTAPADKSEREILGFAEAISVQEEAAIRTTVRHFILIAALAAVFILISGTMFAGKLSEPIRRLTRDVAQIDGGNLEHRIRLNTGDELDELGTAFNKMTSRIQEYMTSLALVTAEEERVRTEIQVASRLQADMLPEAEGAFSNRREFSLYAVMMPAKGVGGDFYDFFLLDDNNLVLVMADVAGKGVPAALFMVVSRTTIRSRLIGNDSISAVDSTERGAALAEAIAVVNDSLCANNKNDMFVTAWIGVLNLETGTLDYINAGHCRPLIRRNDGTCTYNLSVSGFVLAGMEGSDYIPYRMQLQPGDTLLLYTDGVTEATNCKDELYGEAHLKAITEQVKMAEPKLLLGAIWRDVEAFQMGNAQFDDITMLALAWSGNNRREMAGEPNMNRIKEFAAFAEAELTRQGIRRNTISLLLVSLDEIMSNICSYSNAKEVTIGVEILEDADTKEKEVILTFIDDGIPFNPLKWPAPDVKEELNKRSIGGLGIYMVKKRMDRLDYEYTEGKNCLTIYKRERREVL